MLIKIFINTAQHVFSSLLNFLTAPVSGFDNTSSSSALQRSTLQSSFETLPTTTTMSKLERSILVTGGTAGMGYHCALDIARQQPDYQVIVASRSAPNASSDANTKLVALRNVRFMPLDLSSLANVRSFAVDWEANLFPPIHSLVFNAALQFPGGVEYTDDGYEKTFAISHIGHALLFSLLRPYFADTARVVVVSSGTHDPAQNTGMPLPEYNSAEELGHPSALSAKESGRKRYTSAKLANVLYTYALHRRLGAANEKAAKNWTVTAFDPGLMPGTGLAREGNPVERFLWMRVLPCMLPFLRLVVSPNIHSAEESGEALARLAVGSDVEGFSGRYYEGRREIKSSKLSYDEDKQEDLWQWTMDAVARNEEERKRFALKDLI